MSKQLVDDGWRIPDALWARIEPLLPPTRAHPKGGRPRLPDRQAMDAIFSVLRTGCQWKALPRSLGAARRRPRPLPGMAGARRIQADVTRRPAGV